MLSPLAPSIRSSSRRIRLPRRSSANVQSASSRSNQASAALFMAPFLRDSVPERNHAPFRRRNMSNQERHPEKMWVIESSSGRLRSRRVEHGLFGTEDPQSHAPGRLAYGGRRRHGAAAAQGSTRL